jgi:glutamate N-acetyltransferase/amino-acid N-acetyltransferase
VGVTAPEGFVAAGCAGGIKSGGALDLALVATLQRAPVPSAGVFTSNRAVAAPVVVSRAHLQATSGQAAAVVLTSGNANAATGSAGIAHAERLCARVGAELGAEAREVLVCQTGLIGIPFPMDAVEPVLGRLVARAGSSAEAGADAADAIMTTDTVRKEATVAGRGFTVGALAKGAAMLAPDMATMLAVLTTDAGVDPDTLQRLLREAVGSTFNTLSVDGCTSTNDTVLVMANGMAGPVEPADLGPALTEACGSLAEQMAGDAEGATKVAVIRVEGASSDADAHRAARRVAESLLVKCSLNGADPYWGRVVSELGSSGAAFDPDAVSVSYGGFVVCREGVAAAHDGEGLAAHMAGRRIDLLCDLGVGDGRGVVLATDLGYGYIDENRTTS